MKMNCYFLLIIYCNSFIYVSLSSSIVSDENTREVIPIRSLVENIPKPFGSRINLARTFESSHVLKQNRPLTTHVINEEQQSERNEGKSLKDISKQWLYNHSADNNKERNNSFNDLKQFSENARVESQSKFLRRRLPSKKVCISQSNGYRQRCLRKIRKQKMNIPLNDRRNRNPSNHSLGTNENNLSSNIPEYVKNVSRTMINLNDHSSADNLKPVQTISVDSENGPSESPSKPCTCYWGPDRCGCDCVGSLQYDDFQEISKGFFPCRNFTFTMTGGQHYALPPNFFTTVKRVEVFSLIISNSTFEYICDPTPMTSAFKGVMFSVSAVIRLTNVSVRRGWNWKPFEELQSSSGGQVNIVLEDCQLRRLTSDFSSLARGQVDTINIGKSNLEMVGSNAFGTFANMTNFRVPGNKIKNLRRTDFPQILPKLVEMDLRNNQLQKLDDDLFKNMPILKEISLSGNPLIVISEKTFHDVIGQAHLVGLSDIPLNCDCRLQWLKDSGLSDNAVTKRNVNGAICRRPSYLRGVPLEYLSKEHLICL